MYWPAASGSVNPGARYAIEIRNSSGGRVLAVTSVDGVNVLSGDTAAFDQAGYVFDPFERYQISGWRKSNTEVAAFTFTDARDSYAGRPVRPANLAASTAARSPSTMWATASCSPARPRSSRVDCVRGTRQ